LKKNSHVGGLQGLPSKISRDSTGFLCFASCFECKETYDIVFAYKGGIPKRIKMGYETLSKIFFNSCDNYYKDFDCFSFVLPITDPEKLEDTHDSPYHFPCTVKVYQRVVDDKWKFLKTLKINTFEQYSKLRFETIYRK